MILIKLDCYLCRCVIAFNPKVIYLFEVRVCEEIFAKLAFGGFGPFGVIREFLLTLKKKYPEKVISLKVQTNINLHMFRAQCLVNKIFSTSAGFLMEGGE